MEVWKDVQGYEGLYQVSNLGRVKSLPKRKGKGIGYATGESILHHSINTRGYCNIVLCKNGKTKTFLLHKLVAMHFIPNPYNLPQVNHLNECKTDNSATNLEWCTQRYNNTYGSRIQKTVSKLNRTLVVYQNGEPIGVFEGRKAVADALGITTTSVSSLLHKKHKSKHGYIIIEQHEKQNKE